MKPLVEVRNLTVKFSSLNGETLGVKDVSFDIPESKTMAIVGESGSGKSVTSLSIMGLLPEKVAKVTSGTITYKGQDLLKLNDKQFRNFRRKKTRMIFQEPMTSLNPLLKIGLQIEESIYDQLGDKKKRVLELISEVGISDPEVVYSKYPHELSGGQRQRAMIAVALACEPEILIADEPTTALDVKVQKKIIDLLKSLQEKYGMTLLIISHDLKLVADIAESILVFKKGELVEHGGSKKILSSPEHPYTKALIECRPSQNFASERLPTVEDILSGTLKPINSVLSDDVNRSSDNKSHNGDAKRASILEVRDLYKSFTHKGETKDVLSGLSINVQKGEVFGLVGESGCGKSTLSKIIMGLESYSSGSLLYKGEVVDISSRSKELEFRKNVQIIFQDPFSSLNPRLNIKNSLLEGMKIHCPDMSFEDQVNKAKQLMLDVGLTVTDLDKYPHEFSGGQRQRIAIARALSVEPEFIICDESVSALDVSVQSQVINLLLDLKDRYQLTYIFISHDLSVVRFISDRVAIMRKGEIIELSETESLFSQPQTDYTRDLLTYLD